MPSCNTTISTVSGSSFHTAIHTIYQAKENSQKTKRNRSESKYNAMGISTECTGYQRGTIKDAIKSANDKTDQL